MLALKTLVDEQFAQTLVLSDYCLLVTIVDPSNAKLTCNLFNGNRDALPQIYKNGDIVRFHRIKIREFGDQMQGITSCGFSALAFDGTIGAPVVPRTSSKVFTFTDQDKKTVEDLRIWVSSNFSNSAPAAKLSGIQPPMFFELTCQLVGKAKVDGSSYLLKPGASKLWSVVPRHDNLECSLVAKPYCSAMWHGMVWDGTKCPFPPWRVFVHEDDLEGDGVLINQLRELTVDVVVYDNHVQLARSLKVGSVIRMYSLHAKTQSLEAKPDVSYIQFHLHGGTGYGRGITVLPESHTDVRQLKAFLDSVELAERSEDFSPPEEESTNLTRKHPLGVAVLTDHQHLDVTALGTILNSTIPQQYRIRAKLRRFEPRKLHQSVKLHCPRCHLLQEVPSVAELDSVFQEAFTTSADLDLHLPFCESIVWDSGNLGQRLVTVHFVKHKELLQEPEDSLILIEGATSDEVLRLSKKFKGVIPVRSTEDNFSFLDLSAPFLCQGRIQYYGCKHCSAPKTLENLDSLAAEEAPSWELATVAQEMLTSVALLLNNCKIRWLFSPQLALGIAPLRYVFVMKFTLDDGTGTLDSYLMDCKDFFQIPASEVLTNNMLQENMEENMNKLCPPGCDVDDLPWLECFIKSYYVKDGTDQQLCYQIFDTTIAEDI
ncbi:hypothetical protein lerEdw1_004043 [Lerista edwardsae]|nr:hypothetical protein lerEdw1_004043 [Lerista edwardsae]